MSSLRASILTALMGPRCLPPHRLLKPPREPGPRLRNPTRRRPGNTPKPQPRMPLQRGLCQCLRERGHRHGVQANASADNAVASGTNAQASGANSIATGQAANAAAGLLPSAL